ncbi:unnamed protein product, partial [Protopolystoma xenopodis]
ICWPYPTGRPSLCESWRFRLSQLFPSSSAILPVCEIDSNHSLEPVCLSSLALHLRTLWHSLRWDDILQVPGPEGPPLVRILMQVYLPGVAIPASGTRDRRYRNEGVGKAKRDNDNDGEEEDDENGSISGAVKASGERITKTDWDDELDDSSQAGGPDILRLDDEAIGCIGRDGFGRPCHRERIEASGWGRPEGITERRIISIKPNVSPLPRLHH